MSSSNETAYVKQQYATSSNLDARIALHQLYSTAPEHFHDWLFRHVTLPAAARVLEIGCGSGALWERVLPRVPATWQLVLSDLSLGMLETVRAKFQFTCLQTEAQSLPFTGETFDGIFANHMLYHIPDLDRALAEIERVLKRGGVLYAATNGLGHMRELGELVAEISGQPLNTATPEHLFGLENGSVILLRHFQNVTCVVQENNLRVTAVEPLVAYVGSGTRYKAVTQDEQLLSAFRRRVQSEISSHGAYHITKSVGLFIAS